MPKSKIDIDAQLPNCQTAIVDRASRNPEGSAEAEDGTSSWWYHVAPGYVHATSAVTMVDTGGRCINSVSLQLQPRNLLGSIQKYIR